MVMDTPALAADPHFSLPPCRSFFPLSISLIFLTSAAFFLSSFPPLSLLPSLIVFHLSVSLPARPSLGFSLLLLSHRVLLLPPPYNIFFFFFLFPWQPADAGVQYVWTLCEDEAAVPKVLHAEGHPGGVPLHEGPGPLQHQWVCWGRLWNIKFNVNSESEIWQIERSHTSEDWQDG